MSKSYVACLGLLASALLSLPGCAATEADEVAVSEDDLSANGNDGFWRVVGRDFRKCSFPQCGGFYVAKVNGALTRCADGSVADKCYVAQIDLGKLDLPAQQEADVLEAAQAGNVVLRTKGLTTGRIDMPQANANGSPRSGILKAVEGWSRLAPTQDSSFAGTLYRAGDSGIRCITAPCPSLRAAKINGRKKSNVNGIDLAGVTPQPSQEELDAAWSSLAETGFLFATTSTGLELKANAVYTRVVAREEAPDEGPLCGGRGMPQCDAGQTCIYDLAAACGSFDAPGHCQTTTAMLCPQVMDPVCGCDGVTYSNECMAHVAGTSAMSKGACAEPELPPCHVGGCSSQVCSEREGILTTCEFKAEYACYRSATCERQDSGKCGWTQTDALTSCIESSR